jgi:hypothetical protein
VPPVAQLPLLYLNEQDVITKVSANAELLWLNDSNTGTLTPTEEANLTINGANFATAKCNMFLGGRYDPNQLITSWMVNEWATRIAISWMCRRRGNPIPGSLKEEYDEAIAEMWEVKRSHLDLNDIGTRTAEYFSWANVIVRPEFQYAKTRVETSISDNEPVNFQRYKDFQDLGYWEI